MSFKRKRKPTFENTYTSNKLDDINEQFAKTTAIAGNTTITIGSSASTDIGMSGVNLQDEQFSVSDGTVSVTYTYLQACNSDNSDCPSATQLKTGSGRTAAQAAAEIATKINASSLSITASASLNVVTLTPATGVTITVTELNDGQLGGNASDWVAATAADSTTTTTSKAVPFVYGVCGAFNIRKRSTAIPYKTTLK
tara:strand:- start:3237 stop:3827 length:591 start_codon:yes stop_codon:yes gene_type:complete